MSLRAGWMIFAVLLLAFAALMVTWVQYPVDIESAYSAAGGKSAAVAGVAVETNPGFLWLKIATGTVGAACVFVAVLLLCARRV